MKYLEQIFGKNIDVKFTWRDRHGEFHDPKDMHTKHLFHTLRMIWNHSAPEYLKVHPFQKYKFPEFYTSDYMGAAVSAMYHELSKRDDLNDYQINTLQRMADRALELKRYYDENALHAKAFPSKKGE